MPGYGAARQSFHFQFITTPTADTQGTSLYLHFDSKRYLFGQIAEGTQRACIERGVSLKKVRNIFITGTSTWANCGGLIGSILTMSDVQAQERDESDEGNRPVLNIHGAPGLKHIMASARRFVFRTGMPLSLHEIFPDNQSPGGEPTWADENIQVWAIPIQPANQRPGSNGDKTSLVDSDSDDFTHGSGGVERSQSPRPSLQESQAIRDSIIHDMFDSDWRRDRLVEMPFQEVRLPATVYWRDEKTKEMSTYRVDSHTSVAHLTPSTPVFVRNPWPASLIGSLPSAEDLPSEVAVSYIVRGHQQRGRFDASKAAALGVKPGPAFGVLSAGHPVQLEDGSVVSPEAVLGPNKPGQGIAIIHVPDVRYLHSLIEMPEWRNELLMSGINAMVWIITFHVTNTPEFQSFIASLSNLKHVIASPSTCPNYVAMESSYASAVRLKHIWEDVFPAPIYDNSQIPQSGLSGSSDAELRTKRLALAGLSLPAERGLRIQMEPKFEIHRREVSSFLDTGTILDALPKGVFELATAARSQIASTQDRSDEEIDPQIITLGTGSAAPSKYRNVSATLLRIPGHGSYLFDCGENTLGQLSRVLTRLQLQELLSQDLKMIWVSHLHADHHLGTLSILRLVSSYRKWAISEARRLGQDTRVLESLPPLYVVGEEHMAGFLQDYGTLRHYDFAQSIVSSPRGMTLDGKPFTFEGTGVPIKNLQSCLVSHCYGAQAVSVTFWNGFKFSYSGDCRPSENFTKIGAGSDVLVHEATFDDGMEGDAIAKKHSTTGEALAVGARMGAKNVVLTHFSQRYQKIPVMADVKLPTTIRFEEGEDATTDAAGPVDETIDEDVNAEIPKPAPLVASSYVGAQSSNAADTAFLDARNTRSQKPELLRPIDMNVCVAFDYMSIKISQIQHMQKFTPALQVLFNVEKQEADTALTAKQVNEQANRTKGKGIKKGVDEVHGEPKTGVEGGEMKKSNRQLRKEANRMRHEENGADRGNSEKRMRLDMDDQTMRRDRSPRPTDSASAALLNGQTSDTGSSMRNAAV